MITVKVSELLEKAKLMSDEGMDFAILTLLDPIPEEDAPASVGFTAYKKSEMVEYDYDEIEAV